MRVPERFIDKIMEEGRDSENGGDGNLSEYEKSQLSWAHGITSVTGLRLSIVFTLGCTCEINKE